jgi:hypothetical protein
MDEIEVYVTRKIRACCDTCLYFSSNGLIPKCGNANVDSNTFYRCRLLAGCCQHYWLNQHKYRRVEE